ncbi:MAG: polysaccharide deacetylase family protein [Maioricimonas sp. JB045]
MIGKRALLTSALEAGGLHRLLEAAPTWNGLVVLNYHRIGDPAGSPLDWGLWSAGEQQFADQVRYLAAHFNVIGLDDLDDVLDGRRGRHVMITFDDGYRDNYEAAFPILQAYGVPAVFFLTSGFLDDRPVAWWDEIAWMVRCSRRTGIELPGWLEEPLAFDEPDRQQAIEQLLRLYKRLAPDRTSDFLGDLADVTGSGRCPHDVADALWMDWAMVREMRAGGMDIGAHTVSHPVLANLPAEEQLNEILTSRRRIESELGQAVRAFSYPVGQPESYDDNTRSALELAGVRWAFTYHGGYVRSSTGAGDRLSLPRAAVERETGPAELRSLLTLPQVFA